MSFFEAIKTVFTKYAEFRGVAARPEFWWWTLFTFLVSSALSAIPVPTLGAGGDGQAIIVTGSLASLWSIGVLLPSLAVAVRRLRDTGKGWGNLFWMLLPFVGWIILIVLLAQPTRVAAAGYAGPGYPPPGYAPPAGYRPPEGYAPPAGYGSPPGYAAPPPTGPRADRGSEEPPPPAGTPGTGA